MRLAQRRKVSSSGSVSRSSTFSMSTRHSAQREARLGEKALDRLRRQQQLQARHGGGRGRFGRGVVDGARKRVDAQRDAVDRAEQPVPTYDHREQAAMGEAIDPAQLAVRSNDGDRLHVRDCRPAIRSGGVARNTFADRPHRRAQACELGMLVARPQVVGDGAPWRAGLNFDHAAAFFVAQDAVQSRSVEALVVAHCVAQLVSGQRDRFHGLHRFLPTCFTSPRLFGAIRGARNRSLKSSER